MFVDIYLIAYGIVCCRAVDLIAKICKKKTNISVYVYGLDPGIALGSTRVYLSLWRDPRYSSLYFPGATFPVCPGLPNEPLRQRTRCKVGSIVCSLTQSIHFLSYLVFSNQIFQYPLLISTPTHLPAIKLVHQQMRMGFRVKLTRLSHSLRKRDQID